MSSFRQEKKQKFADRVGEFSIGVRYGEAAAEHRTIEGRTDACRRAAPSALPRCSHDFREPGSRARDYSRSARRHRES